MRDNFVKIIFIILQKHVQLIIIDCVDMLLIWTAFISVIRNFNYVGRLHCAECLFVNFHFMVWENTIPWKKKTFFRINFDISYHYRFVFKNFSVFPTVLIYLFKSPQEISKIYIIIALINMQTHNHFLICFLNFNFIAGVKVLNPTLVCTWLLVS